MTQQLCDQPCDECSRKGVPILFGRYGAIYNDTPELMAKLAVLKPHAPLQAAPGSVSLQKAQYALRMLRAGYLYLYIERPGYKEWQAYIVHPQGYLRRVSELSPGSGEAKIACARESRPANNSLVWIEDPEEVVTCMYMFTPDPVDYDHLVGEIEGNLGKYMQGLDIRGWACGGNRRQPDTVMPQNLNTAMMEFAALTDSALPDASEALLYGLMGSSVIERGWGDYVIEHRGQSVTSPTGYSYYMPAHTEQKRLGSYESIHGPRLHDIFRLLDQNEGVIAICEDPFGLAQELGHLLAEANLSYTKWQSAPAEGLHPSVNNEWALQTAVHGQSLMELVRAGAVGSQEAYFKYREENHIPRPKIYASPEIKAHEQEQTRQNQIKNRQKAIDDAREEIETQFKLLFDEKAAERIKIAQGIAFEHAQQQLTQLGTDQVAWLESSSFWQAVQRYTRDDQKINLPGGGAELTSQLGHSLAGSEVNEAGRLLLEQLDLEADNVLTRLLSFNNEGLHQHLQQLKERAQHLAALGVVKSNINKPNLSDEAEVRFIGSLTTLLKAVSGEMTLGNRAITYLDAYKAASEGGRLRGMTWSLHLSSLLSVKMVQGMRGLPPSKVEARMLHFTALTGLSTFGHLAEIEAPKLAQAERDRLRNVTNKVGAVAPRADATVHVSGARSAGLSALFGISFAALKGLQLKDKQDARTGMEMGGALMGGIANIMDYRIRAYELTIAKGQPGLNLFKAPKMVGMTDEMHAKTLKAMRVTSFKFLLPASMISVFWAWRDAQIARKRGDVLLAISNVVGVAGSIFSLASSLMTLVGPLLGVSAKVWSLMAASFGLVGVVFVVGAFVAIVFLKEKEWISWLKDCPLKKQNSISSKQLNPVHGDLNETLSKFFLAQAAI